jgi:SAM-dependent methyltransferase
MDRIPEPELMDDLEQARAYAEADFDEPNTAFVELFAERCAGWPESGAILDLGCGPGDIVLRLADKFPDCVVHGVDGSAAMLEFAERARAGHPAADRVQFVHGFLPGAGLPRARYDAVTSNSLLHHLHQPRVLWQSIRDLAAPGAPVLVMDLMRPHSAEQAQELVDRYADGEPAVLRTDFYNSLLAAFEPDEVRAQLESAGLTGFRVEPVSDRHLAAWGRIPQTDTQRASAR